MTVPYDMPMPVLGDLISAGVESAVKSPQPKDRNSSQIVTPSVLLTAVRRYLNIKAEALRLAIVLPHLAEFFETTCKWRLVYGANRSSKTFSCAIESARAWTGTDPHDKYPQANGNFIVVGHKENSIIRIWRTVARPGAFKVIPDEHTGRTRAVRLDPNNPQCLDPYDMAYRERWRDAPPLIPPRLIVGGKPAWKDMSRGLPHSLQLTNGSRVLFCAGGHTSMPEQGDAYNGAWLDEEVPNQEWFAEVHRGLTGLAGPPKLHGKGIWSATAQTVSPQLLELRDQAQMGSPHVRVFHTSILQNPFIPESEREAFASTLDDEAKRIRVQGIPAADDRRPYGIYDPQGLHGYEFEDSAVPEDWARWVVLDPGVDYLGTLFIAVDPEERHQTIYDGFEMRQATAARWAAELERRQGDMKFAGCIIDGRRGEQKHSTHRTVADEHRKALDAAGVVFQQQGPMSGFFPGSTDVEARELALQRWLQVRRDGPFAGTPIMRVRKGCCAKLDEQIRKALTDPKRPNRRLRGRNIHEDVLVCAEYAAGFEPYYIIPESVDGNATLKVAPPNAYELYQQKLARKRRRLLLTQRRRM